MASGCFYKRLAEIVETYLRKGSQVYIEGSLRTRTYEKEGQTHYITEVIAHSMQMLGSRADPESGGRPGRTMGTPAHSTSIPAGTGARAYTHDRSDGADSNYDDEFPY